MKHKKVIIASMAILIVIIVLASAYYVVFQRPIKSPAEDVALNENDLPGWKLVKQEKSTSSDVVWAFRYDFFNSSADVGNNLTIALGSYSSSEAAHQAYKSYVNQLGPVNKTTGRGDESIYFPNLSYVIESNGTYRCVGVGDGYMFRVANVVVNIWFNKGGNMDDYFDPNGSYHRAWMDEIIQLQVDKLEENNLHLL